MPEVTVFTARRILTMAPGRPVTRAIAVKDGRLLSIGDLDTMRPWLEHFSYKRSNRTNVPDP